MRLPNLNALRMFDAAARHLNFRLAAEELHLTQGAVAQQIRRLEADLGVELFQRRARGLAFTENGRSLHKSVARALAMIDEAVAAFQPEPARIRLSVTPSFAAKWLVPRLPDFAARHPEIELQIIASERLSDFRHDGIDVAIRQGRPPFGKGLSFRLLAPLSLCAVCCPSYAARAGSPARFKDFARFQLIEDGHHHWRALLDEKNIEAGQRMMQFNQTALAMDAAANGQGIALAPRLLLNAELAQGRLTVLWQDTRPEQSGYYIVCPETLKPSPARQAVTDWILTEAGTSRNDDPPRPASPARSPLPR